MPVCPVHETAGGRFIHHHSSGYAILADLLRSERAGGADQLRPIRNDKPHSFASFDTVVGIAEEGALWSV